MASSDISSFERIQLHDDAQRRCRISFAVLSALWQRNKIPWRPRSIMQLLWSLLRILSWQVDCVMWQECLGGKLNSISSQSFEAMTSPFSLWVLINFTGEGSLSWPLFWRISSSTLFSKTSFSVSVVRFPPCLPSVPSPPPRLAQYSAETRSLGSRTGKRTCVQC